MLPRDLVPTEGPAGEPTLELVLDGSPLTVRARLNGKNYRNLLKQVAEHGAENLGVPITDYCDQHRLSVEARLPQR